MKLYKNIVMTLALMALVACSTDRLNLQTDQNITPEKAGKIRTGVTTKAEIQTVFGEPLDRITTHDGEEFFYKDFNLRALRVEFGKNGVVSDYHYDK